MNLDHEKFNISMRKFLKKVGFIRNYIEQEMLNQVLAGD